MEPQEIFDEKATEFKDIVEMPAFIDHSELMKFVMKRIPHAMFIAAPSRTCKTANLKMIKTGLEIEMKNGEPLRSDLLNPATDVEQLKVGENYKLFEKGGCKILQDTAFVLEHFGRYPVVYINFMTSRIYSYEEAVDHCKAVIREAFVEHDYLWKTGKMYENEKKNETAQKECEKWCLGELEHIKEVELSRGLAYFCRHLHSRFGRKVVVLIDGYDAVITSAMGGIEEPFEVKNVISLMSEIIGFVVKGKYAEKYVQKVVITGIFSIRSGVGSSNILSPIEVYHFATEKKLIPFYGICKSDLESLLKKLRNDEKVSKHENLVRIFSQSDAEIVGDLRERFNGYYCEGSEEDIYSLWFVLHHLSGKKIDIPKGPLVKVIINLFRYSTLVESIRDLLMGEKYVKIFISKCTELTVSSVHEIIQAKGKAHRDIFFALLKEEGHLVVVRETSKSEDEQKLSGRNETESLISFVKLEIVNSTIRSFYETVLLSEALTEAGFNSEDLQDCAHAFVTMCNVSGEQSFREFFESFEKICEVFNKSGTDVKEVLVQLVVLNVLILTRFKKLDPESHVKNEDTQKSGFIDVLWENLERTIIAIVEIKWNNVGKDLGSKNEKRSRNIGYKQKTAISGLVQILGKDSALYESLKDHLNFTKRQEDGLNGHVDLLQKEEHKNKKFLLVSISVDGIEDGNHKPSICIVNNKKNPQPEDVMVLSRHEVVDFPDLYKKCTTIALHGKK